MCLIFFFCLLGVVVLVFEKESHHLAQDDPQNYDLPALASSQVLGLDMYHTPSVPSAFVLVIIKMF